MIYRCCICKKTLTTIKPIRLVKQEYGVGKYNQYGTVDHFDFCERCYSKFENWIRRHRNESLQNR